MKNACRMGLAALLLASHSGSFAQFAIAGVCQESKGVPEEYVACRARDAVELHYLVQAICSKPTVPVQSQFKANIEVSQSGVVMKASFTEASVQSGGFAQRAIDALYSMKMGSFPTPVSLSGLVIDLDLNEISRRKKIYGCKAFGL